jgi:hypothetical protein
MIDMSKIQTGTIVSQKLKIQDILITQISTNNLSNCAGGTAVR